MRTMIEAREVTGRKDEQTSPAQSRRGLDQRCKFSDSRAQDTCHRPYRL
jgi:hypothetical protein